MCTLSEKRAQLISDGWRDIPRGHMLAYTDCGIAVETTSDGAAWAPCWAASIVDVAFGKDWLGVILARAAVDEQFRDAVTTITALTDRDPVTDMYRYAESQGVLK